MIGPTMFSLTMISPTMASLTNWLSPNLMHSLGWALLHFIWQGTALAAVAGELMAICRRPALRYAVALGMLALMLAAPMAKFLFVVRSGARAPAPVFPAAVVWNVAANPTRPLSAKTFVVA